MRIIVNAVIIFIGIYLFSRWIIDRGIARSRALEPDRIQMSREIVEAFLHEMEKMPLTSDARKSLYKFEVYPEENLIKASFNSDLRARARCSV